MYKVASIMINKITPSINSTNISGCNIVLYKSKTYTSSTILRDTLRSVQGCDSIYNVTNIIVNTNTVPIITSVNATPNVV